MVHFVTETNGTVCPLCGEWGDDPNWTKIPTAVSCPGCYPRLVRERAASARRGDDDGEALPRAAGVPLRPIGIHRS